MVLDPKDLFDQVISDLKILKAHVTHHMINAKTPKSPVLRSSGTSTPHSGTHYTGTPATNSKRSTTAGSRTPRSMSSMSSVGSKRRSKTRKLRAL